MIWTKGMETPLDVFPKVEEAERTNIIVESLAIILNSRFGKDSAKSKIRVGGQRINFACPYCGDSASDVRKKRGNIFVETLSFHCYNCGEHRNLKGFLNDHDINTDTLNGIGRLALDSLTQRLTRVNFMDSDRILDSMFDESIDAIMFEREMIKERFGLREVCNSSIMTYLEKRLQTDFERFLWDERRRKLYILNSKLRTGKIIGWQVRNFSPEAQRSQKYLTYKWSKAREQLGLEPFEDGIDADAVDKLSYTFNLFNVDFTSPITVFEGPLDSFLLPNSVALCSLHNSVPFDYGTIRFLLDYDEPGRKRSLELLQSGHQVFMWSKFLNENSIEIRKKKVDWNDVMVYCARTRKRLRNISQYFTSDKYDIIHL